MADVQATMCDEKKCPNMAVVAITYEDPATHKVKRKDFCHLHVGIAVAWLTKINKHVHE